MLGTTERTYGWYTLAGVGAFATTSLMAGRFAGRMTIGPAVRAGTALMAAGGLLIMALALSGIFSIAAILGPMMVIAAGIGIVLPYGMAGAMSPHPTIAGAASALFGLAQFGLAALGTILMGAVRDGTQIPMTVIIGGRDTRRRRRPWHPGPPRVRSGPAAGHALTLAHPVDSVRAMVTRSSSRTRLSGRITRPVLAEDRTGSSGSIVQSRSSRAMSPLDRNHTVVFTVHAAADPQVLPRVLEMFALRNVVPRRVHGRAVGQARGSYRIDVETDALSGHAAERMAERLRSMVPVETVRARRRTRLQRARP